MSENAEKNRNQVERLRQSVLPDGVDVDLEKGFISILVDFPNQEQMIKTVSGGDMNTFMDTVVKFITETLFASAPRAMSVTGETGFDPAKPVLLKKISFPNIIYDGVESGKALKINAWFVQKV